MPTIGWFNRIAPVEPRNCASPKAKMPPSRATIQEPLPDGVFAPPTTGWFSPCAVPAKLALPKLKTLPSDENIRYPPGADAVVTGAGDELGPSITITLDWSPVLVSPTHSANVPAGKGSRGATVGAPGPRARAPGPAPQNRPPRRRRAPGRPRRAPARTGP